MNLEQGEFELFCTCVGQIMVPFAIFEASFNATIEITYNYLGGKALEKEIPRAFSKRIEFLTTCLKRLPALSRFRDVCQPILDAADAESEIRNHVAHAYISAYDRKTKSLTFSLLEAYTDKQSHTRRDRTYTVPELK